MTIDQKTMQAVIRVAKMAGATGFDLMSAVATIDLSPSEIAEIKKTLSDPDNAISKAYALGNIQSQMQLENRIYQLASEGNLKAILEFEKRKKQSLNI